MAFKQDKPIDGPKGQALWQRADAVLPGGGLYLSRSADMAGRGVLPGFIEAASGCRVIDADGREYIDYLCANGPNLLGYRHPEIEAVVTLQREQLVSGSLFPPSLVEVVEALIDRFPPMAWGVVSKNGSEVVSLAVRAARQDRQRRRICSFQRAYHGNDPELASAPVAGILTDVTEQVDRVAWNDAQALIEHMQAHGNDTAAILVNPLDQNPAIPTREMTPEFLAALEQVRDQYGLLIILDSVRHGFRLHPDGCDKFVGISPDFIAMGKALGNGYAISALLGLESTRKAARKILYTSTYMFESPPMRAAIKVLEIYDRDDVFSHISNMGERLATGVRAAATAAGHEVTYSGPSTMPSLLFAKDDQQLVRGRAFSYAMAERGIIWHPLLNHFLSFAHQPADIDATIAAATAAFADVPQ